MSTYLYLRCSAHEPPLLSADEVGQHLRDLDRITGWIAERDALVATHRDHSPSDYFLAHAVTFFAAHPHCEIDVVDEYGFEHPVQDPTPPAGTTRVLVPMLCGSRERMRLAWTQAPGSSNLNQDARIVVDLSQCLAAAESALHELVVLADLVGTERTLHVASSQWSRKEASPEDSVVEQLRRRMAEHGLSDRLRII